MSEEAEFGDFRFTIFSQTEDFVGTLALLSILDAQAEFVGPEEHWETIVMFNASGKLTFTSMTAESGDPFSTLLMRMEEMFAPIMTVAIEAKEQVLETIRSCRMAIGVFGEPLLDRKEQLPAVIAVANYLDALIFTGSTMADSKGNIVLDTVGHSDLLTPSDEET